MNRFHFLEKYINDLPVDARSDTEYSFCLELEKNESELATLIKETGLIIPDELIEFYRFSYGAQLGEYEILRPDEIKSVLSKLIKVYGDDCRNNILPFAKFSGVGDIIAYDMGKSNTDGFAVLDGFHEITPSEWQIICFGLVSWLQNMVNNNFEPYWLGAE